MEFKAEFLDLDLKLITLEKEEVEIIPKSIMNTTNTIKIIDQWTKLEKKNDEIKDKEKKINPFDLIAIELEFIYPKTKKWFLDNFDPRVLGEIMTYVARTLGGLKKKEKN